MESLCNGCEENLANPENYEELCDTCIQDLEDDLVNMQQEIEWREQLLLEGAREHEAALFDDEYGYDGELQKEEF